MPRWDEDTGQRANHMNDPILKRMNRNDQIQRERRLIEFAGTLGFVMGFAVASLIAVIWYQLAIG